MYIRAQVKFLAPLPGMWRVLGTTRVIILSVYILVNICEYFLDYLFVNISCF
ncbi:hypothetical protein HanRHA438_Chr11g0503471 [Helianthus annuus]|nr:hypothetical protein HanRHA438_Chr11g0503471 [Helianthus annuus]